VSEVTQLLAAAEQGDRQAAGAILPLVYEELRKLAAAKLKRERPGQTLDATALVHEAYVRLIGPAGDGAKHWQCRGHFFAAAAEAMRRILVERARHKARMRHGGAFERVEVDEALSVVAVQVPDADVLAVDEALDDLAGIDDQAANVVKLHYFLGLSYAEVADLLGISERTAHRNWSYARAWLYQRLKQER
jgi:RNA polymerase sigma factor (TIGR02999 family)